MAGEFREFQRTEVFGAGSLIVTGLVRMDPRTDHVRQKLVNLPAFAAEPSVQVSFFSPDPQAQPMIVWDLTLGREETQTILKITGQTIDAQPARRPVYYASFVVTGPKQAASPFANAPVGTIMAWYSADERLPSEVARSWAFCDGQSPEPGLPPTPAINDGRFLRGVSSAAAGGDTGGSVSHQHNVAKNTNAPTPHGFHGHGNCYLGSADPQSHLPPFHNVRFIIRYR